MKSSLWMLVFIALCGLATIPSGVDAFGWRLFAGRDECISYYLPDNQWHQVQKNSKNLDRLRILIDFAIVVTSKYGTSETNGAVDYALHSPSGEIVRHENGISEVETELEVEGGRGPWQLCFRVSSGALLRPSVHVKIPYFFISLEDLTGDFDWEDSYDEEYTPHPGTVDLGKKEQVESLQLGLMRLDRYLLNVTNEQRFLHARTVRHLKTVESTLGRTFWYYSAIYLLICTTSLAQMWAVRFLFKRSRRQGLII